MSKINRLIRAHDADVQAQKATTQAKIAQEATTYQNKLAPFIPRLSKIIADTYFDYIVETGRTMMEIALDGKLSTKSNQGLYILFRGYTKHNEVLRIKPEISDIIFDVFSTNEALISSIYTPALQELCDATKAYIESCLEPDDPPVSVSLSRIDVCDHPKGQQPQFLNPGGQHSARLMRISIPTT